MRVVTWCSIVCFLISASQAQGASVAIDSFCQTDLADGTAITDLFSIHTNAPAMGGCLIGTFAFPLVEPFAEARGGLDYGISSGEFTSTGYIDYAAYQPPPPAPGNSSFLLSQASISLALDLIASSSGPPRPGQILIATTYSIDTDFGAGGSYLECQIEGLSVPFGFCPLLEATGSPEEAMGLFPFSLGNPFHIHIGAVGMGFGDDLFGPSDGAAQFDLRFQLLELDGTPVDTQLVAVPEPSTLLLLASVVLPILAWRRLRYL